MENETRKKYAVVRGVLDYFPAALLEVSLVSEAGSRQHGVGEYRWARGKSRDHADALVRHLIERGSRDADGVRHTAKVAWRALALLQEELEQEGAMPGRASQWPRRYPGSIHVVGGEAAPPEGAGEPEQGPESRADSAGNGGVAGGSLVW